MSLTTPATKARKPRAKAVTTAVEAAAPARKPRAKKTPGTTPAVARVVHEKVAFPKVARQLSGSFMDFAKKLEAAKDSMLSMGSIQSLMAALLKKERRHSGNTAFHRRAGSRAHRTWARRRAAGRA